MVIPKKMKAAVLFGKNDLRVIQKDVPEPVTGEVLIKVKSCAICGGDPKIVMHNLKVAGGRGEGEKAIDRLIPLMADGKIRSEELITHKFSLDKINEAFDTFVNRKGNAIKVIINP